MDRLPGITDGHRKESGVAVKGDQERSTVVELFSILTSGGHRPTQAVALRRI